MLNFLLLATAVSAVIYPVAKPDPAPKGYSQWTSPIVLPAPNADGSQGWAEALMKAKAFTSSLTLEEKINMTTGVGTTGRCLGNTGMIPRLGFDGLCYNDGPAGIRLADLVSVFPSGINAAATFDKDLVYKRAVALGQEFRGKGVNFALAPGMNMMRAPAGGRNWEMAGAADPYLAAAGASATIQGIQSQGVIACAKHFYGNEQEHFRNGDPTESTNIDERTFHEIYELPFAASIQAGVGSIMCAYNKVNQTYACQNSKLINGILKGEMNFQGPVISDWAALPSGGVDSALAGLDSMMPGFANYGDYTNEDSANPVKSQKSLWGAHLLEAVKNGSVPMSPLDDMVHRTMSAFYKFKQDKGYPKLNFSVDKTNKELNKHVNVQGNHKAIIREIAGASTILLKNEGKVLPLKPTVKSIGIFGSDAGSNPDGPNACGDRACNNGTLAIGWGSGTSEFPYLIAPIDGIKSYLKSKKSKAKINSVLSDSNLAAVKKAAAKSEVCLVFVSADSGEGYLTVEGNVGDRNDLNLWHNGNALVSAVASVCKSTIVVGHLVGPVIVEPWINNKNVKAFLNAGLPGQESGNAIADVLFGLVNPSGRLPYTWAKKASDYGASVLYKSSAAVPQITYNEKLLIDYRWFDAKKITPRYEFGFGLSYSTFAYSDLAVKANRQKRAQIHIGVGPSSSSLWTTAVTVFATIKNTSKMDGSEVAQLYLSYPASAGEPVRSLRGFERIKLKAGKRGVVTFHLTRKDISIYDVPSQSWIVPKGKFTVWVASSSRDLRLAGTFTQ